jgi:hypothetical protein
MSSFLDLYWSAPTLACYDGEGGDAGGQAVGQTGGQAAGQAGNQAAGQSAGEQSGEAKFTQKQVNQFVAEERRRAEAHFKAQNKTLLEEKESRINELLADKSLTTAERDRLQGDYAKVQDQLKEYRSEKETMLRDRKQAEDALNTRVKELDGRAKSWELRYTESTIKRELQEAAVKHNAVNADQLVKLLKPDTKMVAVLDSAGQPTGEYTPVVELEMVKDGKLEKVQLSPAKAVEYMKSQTAQYGNLFRNSVAGGVGGSAKPAESLGSGPIDLANLTQSQYEEIRRDPAKSAALFGRRG